MTILVQWFCWSGASSVIKMGKYFSSFVADWDEVIEIHSTLTEEKYWNRQFETDFKEKLLMKFYTWNNFT